MPTIIDSLIVTLGLEDSNFMAGKSRTDGVMNDLGRSADDTGKKFQSVAGEVGKFLAVIGGTMAIKSFIQQTVEANSALDRLARNLGMSANTVSAWGNAAEIAGGSAEGLQATLSMLSRAQTEFNITGQSSLIPYLSSLGVAFGEPTEMLIQMSDEIERMRSIGMSRTNANNFLLGMGIDQGTANLIMQGREEIEITIKSQGEFNAVTKKQAEEASRLKRSFVESKQSFNAFGRELLSQATPALEKLFSVIADITTWMKNNQPFVEKFLTIIAAGLGTIAIATMPINLTAAAILGLGVAVAALWDDYQVWKGGGDSFFPWGDWKPAIDLAAAAVDGLGDALKKVGLIVMDVGFRTAAGLVMLKRLASGDKAGATDAAQMMVDGMRESVAKRKPTGDKKSATPSGGDLVARRRFIMAASVELGVPPEAIDAQLRNETGATGKSTIGAYNYGNVKAGSKWGGATSSRNVTEYDANGKPYQEKGAAFRAYATPEEAAKDYAATIRKSFPKAVGASDAQTYAEGLKSGGYATDPDYVSKIARIARGIPGASQAATGAGAGRAALNSTLASAGNTSSIETHIGEVKVYTQATDAQGIAQGMGKSLDYLFTSQANYGLN